MDAQTAVVAGIIVVSLGLLLWLPARKHWNAGGEVDVQRDGLQNDEEE